MEKMMQYSNLHTHSVFSDGKHSIEENIQSAIKKDMISIGFSDHSFTYCDSSYCMKADRYEQYLKEIADMKEKYKGKISVYSGLELDYYSVFTDVPVMAKILENGKPDSEYVIADQDKITLPSTDCFDYLIASVHYIIKNGLCYPIDHSAEQQKSCINNAFDGDLLAMAQCYFDMLCEHVERVRPAIVGHFDVLTKFSLMPEKDIRYREIACRALKRILRTCKQIEINTGAISRGWRFVPYPNRYLLETILACQGEIVLGSDSHHKDHLEFYFDEAVNLLKDIGFDHISVFNGDGFERWDI